MNSAWMQKIRDDKNLNQPKVEYQRLRKNQPDSFRHLKFLTQPTRTTAI